MSVYYYYYYYTLRRLAPALLRSAQFCGIAIIPIAAIFGEHMLELVFNTINCGARKQTM